MGRTGGGAERAYRAPGRFNSRDQSNPQSYEYQDREGPEQGEDTYGRGGINKGTFGAPSGGSPAGGSGSRARREGREPSRLGGAPDRRVQDSPPPKWERGRGAQDSTVSRWERGRGAQDSTVSRWEREPGVQERRPSQWERERKAQERPTVNDGSSRRREMPQGLAPERACEW